MNRYVYLFEYRRTPLRGYERELGCMEVVALAGTARRRGEVLRVESHQPIPVSRLRGVTFFERVTVISPDGLREEIIPDQVILEKSARAVRASSPAHAKRLLEKVEDIPNAGREHTYLSHAWHQYKGKFYPQLVRSTFVIAGLLEGSRVFDPFVGSGTTLVETYLQNLVGYGIDLNPLAAYLSRAKVQCLKASPDLVEEEIDALLRRVVDRTADLGIDDELFGAMEGAPRRSRRSIDHCTLPNIGYLSRWFDVEALDKLTLLVDEVQRVRDCRVSMLMWLTVSNLLRDFSLQDPQQLRIQRRKDAPPSRRLLYRFVVDLRHNARAISAIVALRERMSLKDFDQYVACADARDLKTAGIPELLVDGQVDHIVTSPPYATALPYIDTDRLSMFLLSLLKPDQRSSLEFRMIGSREIRKRDKRRLEEELAANMTAGRPELPASVLGFIRRLRDLNRSVQVGFRRENLPSLLLKYFRDMADVLQEMARVLRPGGYCVIIIGNNRTVAGHQLVDIPTGDLLVDIAAKKGLRLWKALDMTDQPAYLPHSQNGIRSETILFFQR